VATCIFDEAVYSSRRARRKVTAAINDVSAHKTTIMALADKVTGISLFLQRARTGADNRKIDSSATVCAPLPGKRHIRSFVPPKIKSIRLAEV